MNNTFNFHIRRVRFDEHYRPAENTRTTTNFANLARGEAREANLKNALNMINSRFNALVSWDNMDADRYTVQLDIISVDIVLGDNAPFPMIEMLQTDIVDSKTGQTIAGITGNNFSSYVRDYDFSVLLLAHNKDKPTFSIPDGFGRLHGQLFQHFIASQAYQDIANKPPVICLSVSDGKVYTRLSNHHPLLGAEYQPNEPSLTEQYFMKMGLKVRYFMPPGSQAPFAFYFVGDLLNDYTLLELASTISTMEAFQKIYRPEIYNANATAGARYQPSLKHADFSLTQVEYDREERSRLAVEQGKYAETHFMQPNQAMLDDWSARQPA